MERKGEKGMMGEGGIKGTEEEEKEGRKAKVLRKEPREEGR